MARQTSGSACIKTQTPHMPKEAVWMYTRRAHCVTAHCAASLTSSCRAARHLQGQGVVPKLVHVRRDQQAGAIVAERPASVRA